jgi:hypothetical protein
MKKMMRKTVAGISLARGIKDINCWYASFAGVRVEFCPVMGRRSGKPIGWHWSAIPRIRLTNEGEWPEKYLASDGWVSSLKSAIIEAQGRTHKYQRDSGEWKLKPSERVEITRQRVFGVA